MASPVTTGVDPKEFLPTLLRFKAMDLMTRMERNYRDHWEELKQELADFIKEWNDKGLNDAFSEGMIRNLEN
jgi:hypothetical protein